MSRKAKKQQYATVALTSLLIVGIVVGVFYAAKTAGWLGATAAAETEFRFNVVDASTGKELDYWNVSVYRKDITDLTDDEIADLTFADYELHDTVRKSYTPNLDKYVYVVKVNSTGYDYQWLRPVLGVNTIKLLNTTTNIITGAISKNLLNTTFTNSTDREWSFFVNTLDSENKLSDKQGIRSIYNFNTDKKSYIVLNITLNTTASASYITNSQAAEIKTNGNSIYLLYDVQVIGQFKTDIKFSSSLNSAYKLNSYAFGYGDETSLVSLVSAFA